jgi:hypothetical protein
MRCRNGVVMLITFSLFVPARAAAQEGAVPVAAAAQAAAGDVAVLRLDSPLRPSTVSNSPASMVLLQDHRNRRWEGAVIGLATFGLATHLFLYSGDSTSLCNRDRNQDAIRARECNAITAGSALVGAGAGYLIGSRIRY